MPEVIKDKVFGEMQYSHRWVKTENINLLGQERSLKIIALAYTGDGICDKQRESYKKFFSMLQKISDRLPSMITEYAEVHQEEIEEHFRKLGDVTDAVNYVEPVSVVFTRDGKAVIMCNVEWDEENGIGIEVTPKWQIDLQDEFL